MSRGSLRPLLSLTRGGGAAQRGSLPLGRSASERGWAASAAAAATASARRAETRPSGQGEAVELYGRGRQWPAVLAATVSSLVAVRRLSIRVEPVSARSDL